MALETSEADKFNIVPVHIGELLAAVGVAGVGLITTLVVPAALTQPLTVAVTEYVPALMAVTPVMDGFCEAELKVFGPDQL